MMFGELDPDFHHPKCPKALRPVKEFLGYVPAWSHVAELTVREIILHEANVHGGVHAGESKTAFDRAADKLNQMLRFSGFRLTLQHLVSISKCALHALQPLEKATLPTSR